jgi:PEGA domain
MPMRGCLIALVCLLAACAPTRVMMITSTPPGAVVRVNGAVIGETPTAVNTDTLFPRRYMDFQLGSQTAITISKEGCQNQVVQIAELSVPNNVHVDLVPGPSSTCE